MRLIFKLSIQAQKIIYTCIVCFLYVNISICYSNEKSIVTSPYKTQSSLPFLRIPIDVQTRSVDPTFAYYEASIELTEQLFLGLLGFEFKDSNLIIVPELAKTWRVNDNGKIYRFELRDDVYWTKGITGEKMRKVTAKDIVWAVQRNINPETDAPYAFILYALKNGHDIHTGKLKDISAIGVKALSDFTVEFELENPASYFPSLLTLWIFKPLPPEQIKKHGSNWSEPDKIWTNGPYFLDQWHKHWKMNFKKNPNFYDKDQVQISELHYFIIPESFAGLHMYKENKLDILGDGFLRLPPSEVLNITNDEKLGSEFYTVPRYFTYCYLLNTQRPPLNNTSVRRAISLSIDRDLLVDIITHGKEDAAQTFTPPFLMGIDNKKSSDLDIGIHFDPKKAKELLEKEGYSDGTDFPELILMHPISEVHTSIAKAISSFLKHYHNIKVKIIEDNWDNYSNIAFQKDRIKAPHITPLGWGADYLDAHNWLNDAFSYSQSFTGWKNKNFDEKVAQAGMHPDQNKRYLLYQKAEKILVQEECAIVPLFFETAKYLIKPRVKNWFFLPTYGQQLMHWSIENHKN
ncbi:Bacterial extracellular solute-binding protein, family 5 [Candidatus Magnetomorum sp. HK-1]|nr:Bacterial extracellular solute-binding protein, family 5 [Candidatus Magnetomorum sp. HK-1]